MPFLPKVELIKTHDNHKFLESEWTVQRQHQIAELPPFALFFDEPRKVLEWISEKSSPNIITEDINY